MEIRIMKIRERIIRSIGRWGKKITDDWKQHELTNDEKTTLAIRLIRERAGGSSTQIEILEKDIEWKTKTAPAIVRRQIKQIMKVVLPKLKWYDRLLFERLLWFAKRKWTKMFFMRWFKRKVIFHEFKLDFTLNERFLLFEKVQLYNRFYDLDLPL